MKKDSILNKVLAFIACILTVMILVTACAQPAKPPAPPAPPVQAGPKIGGSLIVGLRTLPTSLDSTISGLTGATASYAMNKTYMESLLKWTGKSQLDSVVAPLWAKSWEVSPDGLTYTFKLREGVRFHNVPPTNGREATAEDIAYGFNYIIDPAHKNPARMPLDMKSAEALDKYTVRITINNKQPGWIAYMASNGVYPKEVWEGTGGPDKNWAGTGPFILTEFNKDAKAVFVKNPDYWDKGKPYLDRVEFAFIADPAARLAAFRTGQIDVLPVEGKVNRDAIEKTVPGAQIQDGIALLGAGLYLNNKVKPFDSKQVRQAIQYAIDYDGLIKAALDGAAMRHGFLAPWFAEYGGKQAADLPKRDIAKAKALLAQAGYPDGFKTTMLQNTGNMEFTGNATEPLVAMLKEVGIDAAIIQTDNPTFLSKWRTGNYDTAIWSFLTERPYDPDMSFSKMWTTKAPYNVMGYSNPKMDELVPAQQAAFPDKAKRISIIKEILSILEEEVPSVPLYIMTNYFIKQPWVKGWDDMGDPQGNYSTQGLPNVWIDKK